MKKTYTIFVIGFILSIFSVIAQAESIEPRFVEMNLVSHADSLTFPIPEPGYNISEIYRVDLKGIGTKKNLEVRFQGGNVDNHILMINNIQIQYCVLQEIEDEEDWSQWMYLSQLPLVINLRVHPGPKYNVTPLKKDSPAFIVLLLRFRVTEPAFLKPGVYTGEMSLRVK